MGTPTNPFFLGEHSQVPLKCTRYRHISIQRAERLPPSFQGPPDIGTGYAGIGVWGVQIKALGNTSNLVTGKELSW